MVINAAITYRADGSLVNSVNHFTETRRFTHLEAYIQAQFSLGALAGFDKGKATFHIHSGRFFAVNVLTGFHNFSQVLRMKKIGGAEDDHIHIFTMGNLLIGFRPFEHQFGVDAGISFLFGNIVPVISGF